MLIDTLEQIVKEVLQTLHYDQNSVKIIKSNRPDLCDYQFDGIFKMVKQYGKNPMELAKEIQEALAKKENITDYFSKIEVAPPGFINFSLSDVFINKQLIQMNGKEKFNIKKPEKVETFVLDYGGYNIAKPLHIGHLRPSIIGESIKRIINYMGHKTIADVHLGDYGLQMGQVIYGILRDKKQVSEIDIEYLNKIYPEVSAMCKENASVKEECAAITKDLQESINQEYVEIWNKIVEVSLEDIRKICNYLDVSFDLWEGEKDAYEYLPAVEDLLTKKNLLELSEGATIVNVKKDTDNKPMPPMIFKKSNGAYVYDSTDVATIYERKQKFNPDHIIYVTDFRQNLHFEQVFRVSDLVGLVPYESLEHAYNGTINGTDGKPFKTRAGGVPKLRELFTLVKETFVESKEENKDMPTEDVDIIVNAIIKFADLQNNRDKDYIFDVEKFSKVVGKTGPYILYTYVRINKLIKENTQKAFTNIGECIYNKQDRDLRLQLLNLESALQNAFEYRMPNYIANYIYDTCVLLNAFYQNNHINSTDDEVQKNDWLYVLNLANKIIKEMLTLLMIDIPSAM